VAKKVFSGDYASIKPSHIMTHDNTAAVIPKFNGLGASAIKDPRQVVFTLDHNVQDTSDANLEKYANIAAFAKEHGVDAYPAGRGIGHQVLCEEGYVYPYRMVVASDSHSNMYVGLGCLGTPVVRTDAAALWATGETWWQVPPVAHVKLEGQLQPGVTGKDVIVTLCGHFNEDEVLNHVIEFGGDGVKHFTVDDRLSIANMTTEWGALAGVFPADAVTFEWLAERRFILEQRGLAGVPSDADTTELLPKRCGHDVAAATQAKVASMMPDEGCSYARTITLDISTVRPHVSGPNGVKVITSVDEMESRKLKIDKAYLVSCVNSRAEDIAAAADVLRGNKVADGVEFYVAAASNEVQAATEKAGDWDALLEAGAIPLPPGCGPCIGLGKGLLQDGEVGISATNRNFRGRMGSPEAEAYLASPLVVAASAMAGYIASPIKHDSTPLISSIEIAATDKTGAAVVAQEMHPDFPKHIEGRLIFCPEDNINTDGIYPGAYTYKELTVEEMREVVMENYCTSFVSRVQRGDVLVAGYNFGTGSSREQAATALNAVGISAVICGSANQTYKRNAINNGLIVLEVPELVDMLFASIGRDEKVAIPGTKVSLDLVNGNLEYKEEDGAALSDPMAFKSLGAVTQELIVLGGLEAWVRAQLA